MLSTSLAKGQLYKCVKGLWNTRYYVAKGLDLQYDVYFNAPPTPTDTSTKHLIPSKTNLYYPDVTGHITVTYMLLLVGIIMLLALVTQWFSQGKLLQVCSYNNSSSDPSFTQDSCVGGGVDHRKHHNHLWTFNELTPYLTENALFDPRHRFAFQIHKVNIDQSQLGFVNVQSIITQIPVSKLTRLGRDVLKSLCRLHNIQFPQNALVKQLQDTILQHNESNCSACLSSFTIFTQINDGQAQAVKKHSHTKLPQAAQSSKEKSSHRLSSAKFPPDSPSKVLTEQIITGYCSGLEPDVIKEEGCAVCGQLHVSKQMTLL